MAKTLSSESVARGETDNSLAPGDYTPNFEWMKEHIGDVLVQGIAETLLLRPEDPIEYLGQWLAQHARNLELEKKLLNERTVIQAEVDEKKRVIEEKKRHALVKLEREQRRKHAHQRAQDEVKAKAEAEQRAKELDLIRAERTENKPPPLFGIPETIVEVPSTSNV
ncbi:hypothetical protein BV898_05745 [Hypsibius exemplaris]|uniref:DPY30 domain-containing protein 1 n=1 Tax=Hypsibius exemplaris TaxID=2072580 RepID=A0A1W0WYA8_HYPEX|nr:hypothetical protein BV898_05745 [Hypsibius exemplaris]